MNSKIIKLLKDIVPTYYLETTQCPDKYCIFSYYDEQDSMFYDDTNLSETYYITINYWYKRPADMMLYKQIKNILMVNGLSIHQNQSQSHLFQKKIKYKLKYY